MSLTGSQLAPTFARFGVMRLGASRLGYYQPNLTMTIDGIARKALSVEGLVINDIADGLPNTATMRVAGFTPVAGQEVRIGLGNLDRGQLIFAGHIINTSELYFGGHTNIKFDLTCISYEWLLKERLVNGTFTVTSATDLVLWIMGHTSGFSTAGVESGLPEIDEITFTDAEVPDALEQVKERIGASWVIDYVKTLHFGMSIMPWSSQIHDITTAAPCSMEGIVKSVDLSQVKTRQPVEGGGVGALAEVPPGETILPVAASPWYSPTGGVVKSGPQRIAYTGIVEGGTGGLVGPGAAPSSGPALAQAAGSGVETGAHAYAVTFQTAAGESIAGPLTTITVGTVAPPSSAPVTASVSSGGSVDAGDHDYAATFVTATGETTPSPISSPVVTTGGAAGAPPSSAPTAGSPSSGGSVDPGAHYYAVTFDSASGETAPSSNSGTVTTRVVTPPSSGLSGATDVGGNLFAGIYKWWVTFVNPAGETTPQATEFELTMTSGNPTEHPSAAYYASGDQGYQYQFAYTWVSGSGETLPSPIVEKGWVQVDLSGIAVGPSGTTARRIYRSDHNAGPLMLIATLSNNSSTTYRVTGSETTGAAPPSTNTAGLGSKKANLTGIPISADATVTARRLYRSESDHSAPLLVTTISDNSTTTYTDNLADASLGTNAPVSNGATVKTVALTGIQTGPSGTTARKVYRTAAGGSQLKLLTTIANNSATTFSDTIADSSLGANAPTGATLNTVNVTGIPLGTAPVTARKLYRRSGGAGLKLVATIADNVTTIYTDTTANASLGAAVPVSNTATANRVSLTSIPIGDATVTGRKVYRTVAAGSQLKLVTTIANNTGTTYTDSTADGSLGANAPLSDTSGLAQPDGQVSAGSVTLIVANSAGFSASGGWAVIGNGQQVIRYTGLTASTLTGIPASGAGAIVASIGYNSTVTQAPALTGVPASGEGSISYTIKQGDEVNVFVLVDDVAAQSVMAVLLSTPTRTHSGIIEAATIQDRRLSYTEAANRGLARLTEIKTPLVNIAYMTRDMTTRSGLEVTITLDAPSSISGTFKVQQVSFARFESGFTRPWRTVNASSRRFSLEAILRLIKAA